MEYLEFDMCHHGNKRNTTCDISSGIMKTIDSQQFGIDDKSDVIFDWHPPWRQDSNVKSGHHKNDQLQNSTQNYKIPSNSEISDKMHTTRKWTNVQFMSFDQTQDHRGMDKISLFPNGMILHSTQTPNSGIKQRILLEE